MKKFSHIFRNPSEGWGPCLGTRSWISAYAGMTFALFFVMPAHAQTDGERSFLCHRSATYTPAVTVNGKPVTRADIDPMDKNIIVLPPTVQIPITMDLAQWLQLDLPQGTRMESVLGFAEVAQDGKVTWNGNDISPNVDKACSSISVDGK